MKKVTSERFEQLPMDRREEVLAALRSRRSGRDDAIPRRPRPGRAPLSFPQKRLWLFDRLQPRSIAYNELSAFRLRTEPDLAILEKSLNYVVARHEILRTSFPNVEGEPVQEVAPEAVYKIAQVEAGELDSEEEFAARIQRAADYEIRQVFDLEAGPLFRLTLLRCGRFGDVLFLVGHHIILDGWSADVFIRELTAAYGALIAGDPPALEPLAIQYSDFSAWQHARWRRDEVEADLAYWTDRLRDLPPVLSLPVCSERPRVEGYSGAVRFFVLDAELSEGLRRLSKLQKTTAFTTFLAAFQVLLYRYSAQSDFAIGTFVANRNRTETEGLIGLFVNALVLRADVGGNPPFRELLARAAEVAIGAFSHQDVPYEFVLEAVAPKRSTSYNPLFQVVLNFQNTPNRNGWKGALEAERIHLDCPTSKFDLILNLESTPEGFAGYWQYNDQLFAEPVIARMTGHLQRILEGVTRDPDMRVDEIPLLTEAEARTITREWGAGAPLASATPVLAAIEGVAAAKPDAPAVSSPGGSCTYADLNARANRFARVLIDDGLAPGDLVAIDLPRSLEAIVAVLGVLKAGGAYAPIDREWPSERVGEVLVEGRIGFAVGSRPTAAGTRSYGSESLVGDGAEQHCGNPNVALHADAPAYVIHTSGSTGLPKGVVVSRGNLAASTAARLEYYGEPVERFLVLSSLSFDSSVAGVFWTLVTGGTLVLPTESDIPNVADLCDLVVRERISHLLCIPALYELLLEEIARSAAHCPSLRTAIVAGEACPARVVERHHQVLPSCRLHNEYGPTEATVWATAGRLNAADPVTVGRPVPGTQVYVLDAHGGLLPVGVPGELYVGGAGVAIGYLGRPDLTAERFGVRSPAGERPMRLYRTGDLARFTEDGRIELKGRVDDQIKIRGHRLELAEIEQALLRCEGVRDAAVVHGESPAGPRLTAWIAVADGADAEVRAARVREELARMLPGYAMPAAIRIAPSLPRLSNGKVDRRTLRERTAENESSEAPPQAWSDAQNTVAEVWRQVLGVGEFGLDETFFEVGGDSLSAVRVHNRLQEIVVREINITDMFEHQTVRELARFVFGEDRS